MSRTSAGMTEDARNTFDDLRTLLGHAQSCLGEKDPDPEQVERAQHLVDLAYSSLDWVEEDFRRAVLLAKNDEIGRGRIMRRFVNRLEDMLDDMYERPHGGNGAKGEELLRALALASYVLSVTADDALLSADEPYTARRLFGAVRERVDPVLQRLVESEGLDLGQVDEQASEELREIKQTLRKATAEVLEETKA